MVLSTVLTIVTYVCSSMYKLITFLQRRHAAAAESTLLDSMLLHTSFNALTSFNILTIFTSFGILFRLVSIWILKTN